MPASVTTLRQRATSALTSLAYSAPLTSGTSEPFFSQAALIMGSAIAALTSLVMRSIASGGVPFFAKMPYHVENSKPGSPASADVGTSGIAGTRFGAVIASPRSVPAAICGAEVPSPSNTTGT